MWSPPCKRGNSDFFGHGNDQESSSEAINAWAALAFLGEFTGNKQMRDLGVYLYVTEIASVLNYWFDIHGIVFDPKYPADREYGLRWWLRLHIPVDRGAEARFTGLTCSRLPRHLSISAQIPPERSAVGYRVHEGAQS